MTTILTNQLSIHYDLEKIDQDYDFFKIQRADKPLYGAHILDLDFVKVESIVFQTGHTLYLMCQKNTLTKYDFNEYFMQNEYMNDYFATDITCDELVDNQILIQLFINALSNFTSNELKFNNLTGAFYTTCQKLIVSKKGNQIYQFDALKIQVHANNIITFSANRFNSVSLRHKMDIDDKKFKFIPKYELQNNGTLKRIHKGDFSEAFILRALKGEKAHIPFLNISKLKKFNASKMGILAELLEALTINYGEYFSFEFLEQKGVIQYPVQAKQFDLLNHFEQFDKEQLVYLIDRVNDESSIYQLKQIQNKLRKQYRLNSRVVKQPKKQGMNIVYVHEADYYKKNNLKDPYIHDPAILIQHLTVEAYQKDLDLILEVILKELIIKKDIENRYISIVNWQKFQYVHDWIFICKIPNIIDAYYGMKIAPNGQFLLMKVENDLFNQNEFAKYVEILSDYKAEGLIKDHKGNINLIYKTNLYAIPNIQRIRQVFKDTDKEIYLTKNELNPALDYVKSITKSKNILSEIQAIKAFINSPKHSEISKEILFDTFKNSKLKEYLNQYFMKEKSVYLFPYFRNKHVKADIYQGSLDICYWQLNNDRARYCVGYYSKNLKTILDTGVVIREIQAIDNAPIFCEELLPLMDVDFIRWRSLTILPFPFKYLREFAKKENVK